MKTREPTYTKRAQMMLTADVYKAVQKKAAADGVPISLYLRRVIERHIRLYPGKGTGPA